MSARTVDYQYVLDEVQGELVGWGVGWWAVLCSLFLGVFALCSRALALCLKVGAPDTRCSRCGSNLPGMCSTQ